MNSGASSAGGAEDAGAFAVPAHDRAGRRRAEPDAPLAVALAVADVERAQLGALARREEVAALEPGEFLAAQAGVAEHEHDRQVARAGERVVGDPRLRRAQQPLVLHGAERLGRLRFGALRARQPDRERVADLRGGQPLVRDQPAQEAVERRAVLAHRRRRAPAGDQVRVVARDVGGGQVGRRAASGPSQRTKRRHARA